MAPPIKKWTPNDEAQLQRLLQAKTEFEKTAKKPLLELMHDLMDRLNGAWQYADLVEVMIDRADDLRDALAPFDSGVRPTSPSDSTTR